ncbi:MAG: aldose epimerase family protein [Pseudomonadota bacterium]
MTTLRAHRFGEWTDGQSVDCLVLANDSGMQAHLVPVGASLQSLLVADRDGELRDVVLGYDDVAGYAENEPYLGCTVGRFANRIANARCDIDGTATTLTANAGDDHLHGGSTGISRRLWAAAMEQDPSTGLASASFYVESPHGEDGYPGNVTLRVRYTLDQQNSLHIEYFARTDLPTIINLTNHSYFNLNGHNAGDIGEHTLRLFAAQYTPSNARLLPTGEIANATGALDFSTTKPLAAGFSDETLADIGGYDHNFVIDRSDKRLTLAAVLASPASGIRMAVTTSEPAVQLYTANTLAVDCGKGGVGYLRHEAVCLETQRFPDAPNQPTFPPAMLLPDALFYSKTIYRFDTLRR